MAHVTHQYSHIKNFIALHVKFPDKVYKAYYARISFKF